MIQTKEVGPFVVKTLTVDEGLDLMVLVGQDDQAFNKQLLLRTVSREGKPINGESFSEVVPHLAGLINAAMELNGFRTSADDSMG